MSEFQRVTVRTTERIVRVSPIGQRGPKGDTGSGGGDSTIIKQADGAISGHRIVRQTGVNGISYVDVTDASQVTSALGMTENAASDGGDVTVRIEGEVTEGSWSWTPLQPIYLSANGMMTQTPPTSPGAAFVLSVGYALSSDTMRVHLGIPILLI
jgi:hypothetical protein